MSILKNNIISFWKSIMAIEIITIFFPKKTKNLISLTVNVHFIKKSFRLDTPVTWKWNYKVLNVFYCKTFKNYKHTFRKLLK